MMAKFGAPVAGLFSLLLLFQVSCSSMGHRSVPTDETDFGRLFATGEGYTLVNLHPDESTRRLSAENFQGAGLLPRCSRVEFTRWSGTEMRFRVVSTGREYTYEDHPNAVVLFDEHLGRYFSDSCDAMLVEDLSELDRQGVKQGRAMPGMTKKATLLAIGFPTFSKTPSLLMAEWNYQKTSDKGFVVVFDEKGQVSEIRE